MNRLAVAYYPEHVAETQWSEDLRLMREAGISMVRVFEFAWSRLQPRPGVIDLEWCERFLTLAAEYQINVVACTPTAAPPPWYQKSYPDTVMWTGLERAGVGSRRTYCFSSERFREDGLEITRQMARSFRKHANVVAWQVDNELGFNFCKCDRCLERFQLWLADRYENVENLNASWGLAFWSAEALEWNDVAFGMTHPEAKFAEKRFFSDLVIEFLNQFVDELKSNHPEALITTNFMGNFEQVDYFKASERLDVVGWDMYPELYTISSSAMAHDLMRCAKRKPHWTLENSTGCLGNWLHLDPRHMILIGIQAWAHGEEVHTLFPWRPFRTGVEQNIWGLVDHAGRPTRYHGAAKELSEVFSQLPEVTMEDFTASVGFLYAYESFWGYQSIPGNPNYYFVIDEFYRPLQALGLMIDVVSERVDFSQYRVLFVPSHMLSDERLSRRLREFVEAGGHLIMGPQSMSHDSHLARQTKPAPFELTDVFGADVAEGCYTANYLGPDTSCLGCDAASVSAEPPGHERFRLTSSVSGLDGAMAITYISFLNVSGAEVWAQYEEGVFAGLPAITHHAWGKGTATYVGCMLESAALQEIYVKVLGIAGVPATKTAHSQVEVVRLAKHTVYLNHRATPCQEAAPSGRWLIGKGGNGQVELGPYGFAVVERLTEC